MTEFPIEQQLRGWFETAIDDQPPLALRASVLEIPERGPGRGTLLGPWPNLRLAVVLLLLLALLAASAVAFGSGLLRLPWLPPDRSALVGTDCRGSHSLLDGRLVELRVDGEDYIDGDVWGMTDGADYHLFADGLLVTRRERTRAEFRAADSRMTALRLTPAGVRSVLDAIDGSGLLRECDRGRFTDSPYRALTVRWEDGAITSAAWGRGYPGEFTYMMSEAEAAAAAALEQLFADPAAALPGDLIAARAAPYEPAAWRYLATHVLADELYTWGDGPFDGPPSDAVHAPSGVPLSRFGGPWSEPEFDPEPMGRQPMLGRCAILNPTEARALAAALTEHGASVSNHNWWLRDVESADKFSGDRLAIQIRPLLPPIDTCAEAVAELIGAENDATASPTPLPTPRVGNLGPIDPCSLLADAETDGIDLEATRGEIGELGRDYRHCSASREWSGMIAVRIDATSREAAAVLAGQLLGAGMTRVDAADHVVWLNDCMTPDGFCGPAFALSAEPYFLMAAFYDRARDRADVALELAAEIATRLLGK